jgi:hypothetical protein
MPHPHEQARLHGFATRNAHVYDERHVRSRERCPVGLSFTFGVRSDEDDALRHRSMGERHARASRRGEPGRDAVYHFAFHAGTRQRFHFFRRGRR